MPAKAAEAGRRLATLDDADLVECLREPAVRRLLLGVADQSPYLWGLVERDEAACAALLSRPFDVSLAEIVDEVAADDGRDEAATMRLLRRRKRHCALLVALA
ncbi:MAG: bifunctional [glutamine synthetase] adenylyltransferase/[glutamine synthetase]-adenylyl-L-tyrosine phosphorylase, partial [Hyphomicrobiales bacterium]|nr:bifunctional [glutamine synthetase] adenylyltransferase/[glutamine synthetase]-adenylyl-L-tyrosine phosphorylase [Hyphomicrobiales bacterium]